MDLHNYWVNKLNQYSQQNSSLEPSIFATQVIRYFPPTGTLLDLGAGIGQDSYYFAQKGYHVVSTDIVIDEAIRLTPPEIKDKISFKTIDLSQPLPFPNQSFEIVYCHLSLHFFDTTRTQQLFNEIFSILKPSGVFAVMTNTTSDPELQESKKIADDLFITPSGLQKRFFSIASMRKFTSKFEILLLDNRGETHKDQIKTLVRFVGKKSDYG